MNVCGLIKDELLRKRLARLAAKAGWSIHLVEDEQTLIRMLAALTPPPDAVLSDSAELFSGLGPSAAAWVLLDTARNPDLPAEADPDSEVAVVDSSVDDETLMQHVKTCVNARRFRARFAELDRIEPITSLPRHEELFQSLIAHKGRSLGLIIVQLDHAEHLYADLDPVSKTDLLAALGQHIQSALPKQARLGFHDAGCFIIALPQIHEADLQRISQRLLASLRRAICYRGGEIYITVSLGYSFEATFNNTERLWSGAWQAMCAAVDAGGNRAHGDGDSETSERILRALDREEFSLVLQAQWNIQGDKLRGVEALLRWQGMEVGELAPSQFIPIAEKQGYMGRIGDWVLERACSEASTWFERLVDPILLAVNVSPQQFHKDAILNQIRRFSAERWLNPGMLELELSHENMLLLVDDYRDQLYTLRDWGVRFALDNLGNSLIEANKLLRCPADTLKIDRGLISGLGKDPQTADLVQQICQLGQRFKLRVVAVGVETTEQLKQLADYGCSDVQGYLLSSPVPLTDFHHLLGRPEKQANSH
ncbi:MAG: bifunctional diguanylate cyclase/phosphodiesterase [Gammaproteobacteria bacterium]|nr:bifunctional diguanylate cyclase/phosphodiesterase [Gammaproteobacteria bacterium]